MSESTTITLPTTMPLRERLSEVNKRLSEWITSLENPFNVERDTFELNKYDRTKEGYCYQYIIQRDAKITGNVSSSPYKFVG